MPYCNRCGEGVSDGDWPCGDCRDRVKTIVSPANSVQSGFLTDLQQSPGARLLLKDAPTPQQSEFRINIDDPVVAATERTTEAKVEPSIQLALKLVHPRMLPHFKDLEVDTPTDRIKTTMNRDRRQCTVCGEWFFNKDG